MKNRLPGFCFFILCILLKTVLAKLDPLYEACVPETCGDGQKITFPFYIRDKQVSSCGYPGFEVSCNSQGNPVLNLQNIDYLIHQIFYKDQILRLSNAAVVSATNANSTSCIDLSSHRIQNVSLPEDRFALLSNQTDLVLLYNCSSSLPDEFSKYKEGICEDYENKTVGEVLALVDNDPNLENVSRGFRCGDRVVAPVDMYGGDSGGFGIAEVLNKGFLLNWTASNCSVCEASGGKCGFNSSTYHFRCFCPDRPHGQMCDPGNAKTPFSRVVIAIVATAIGMLIILAFCFIRKNSSNNCLLFWKKKTEDCQKIEDFLRNHGSLAPKRYSYSDIKKMTNSFKHKLGQGGYGGVYRGSLLDGSNVAVKVLNESKGNGEEFINEVATISRTSHVNIVTLLGFCFEDKKRALIYEFMSNGSLEKFIFERNQFKIDHKLKWEELYKIAVGIARGLEYLHRGCNTRILHFDIKPHNILLDEDFCPKISDFGLAKICPQKESIVSMTGARGTIGYIAPEVFCRNFGAVSHKTDVYSYGMMVLDMTGGRINNNARDDNSSEMYFSYWIYQRLKADEEIGFEDISKEDDKECVKKLIIVSLWCIQTNPSDKPTISRVVEMLEGSLDSLRIPPKPFATSLESPG
ncbi:LEAF RUST 10 DISEASE-RESISTANCE LOCUS RECEPTOR-LIKE PROTEIN KINASE-like 2.1 isoform X1 [Mangifera indica]|uniref:LEAF RUST 10 DISEASE-RESISTANCE LOCUS RECEPTOR-LIKE PROTEIN KINASE-like 2.1 isoform X1 n=2 Tax=Mangifera indica TaxID=29780 RepID=UPI001CFB5CC8|nr:LEAF RUST 10 DISEASE-RESISTANCE LOCUS RECEPTOR-LIKE PROTEIN KINASE-like 2.1 isoform X1 [Mangifera indica]